MALDLPSKDAKKAPEAPVEKAEIKAAPSATVTTENFEQPAPAPVLRRKNDLPEADTNVCACCGKSLVEKDAEGNTVVLPWVACEGRRFCSDAHRDEWLA